MTEANGNAAPNSNTGLEVLFQVPKSSVVLSGANQLEKTAHLTQVATDIATHVLSTVSKNVAEYKSKIEASQVSHDTMDDLINEVYPLAGANYEFLLDIEEDELDKMIRSQQSKRSRAKGKTMTVDNYKVMMVGAVAENLLRIAGGPEKLKNAGGGSSAGDILTDEDYEALAVGDPEELKKAIRNVQSKKSIMKSKAGFNEEDPRWKALLIAEEKLKAVRDRGMAQVSEEAKAALEAKRQTEELLADVDLDNLDSEEAAKLLRSVREMLVSK